MKNRQQDDVTGGLKVGDWVAPVGFPNGLGRSGGVIEQINRAEGTAIVNIAPRYGAHGKTFRLSLSGLTLASENPSRYRKARVLREVLEKEQAEVAR